MVFPTALYGCEAWTIHNTDAKRITSFEMKCYRKILRISWMEKVTNKEVLSRLDIKTTMLLQKAKTLKLKYFGHIKRHDTLVRHILEARIDGRRGRGRPTRRWEQDVNDWMDMTTTQAGRLAEDCTGSPPNLWKFFQDPQIFFKTPFHGNYNADTRQEWY